MKPTPLIPGTAGSVRLLLNPFGPISSVRPLIFAAPAWVSSMPTIRHSATSPGGVAEHAVRARDVIVEVPPRRAVDEAVAVAQVVEVEDTPARQQVELDELRQVPVLQRDPVEAVIAEELVGAFRHQEDVVAALAPVVVLAGTAAYHVVAADRIEPGEQVEHVAVVAEDAAVVPFAVVDPVVAGAGEHAFRPHRAVDDDVVAGPAEVLDAVVAADDEVVAVAADRDVAAEARAGADRVVAGAALQHVVAGAAEQDVVAVAPFDASLPSAVEAIVAVVAVDGVVADVGLELSLPGPPSNSMFLPRWSGSKNSLVPSGSEISWMPPPRSIGAVPPAMRSFIQAAPGTTRACVGCHEDKSSAPPADQRSLQVLSRPPNRLQPESWGGGHLDYPTMVQPILNRHCVSCHGGEKDIAGLIRPAVGRSTSASVTKISSAAANASLKQL